MVAPETNSTDFIVYEEEVDKETIDLEMVKMETLNNSEYFETEWIEEEKEPEQEQVEPSTPKKVKRVLSLPIPKTHRLSTTAVLDSADDQRIRETANMFCEMCHEPLDSLREAKSHYKLAHTVEGYIVCCER